MITIQGDLNLDLLTMTRTLHDFLVHNGLTTTITTPTRHHHATGTSTLIDPTLTTCTTMQITAGTISPPITDHLPTCTIFHTPTSRTNSNTTKTLTKNRYNRYKSDILPDIHAALAQLPHLNNPTTTTSQRFLDIQTSIQRTIEQHERRPKPRKPWTTTKMKRYIKHQHTLHTKMKNNPTPENIKRHRAYRNRLKKKIRQAKRQTLKEQLDETRDDPKQQAKILKSVLPSKSGERTSPTTLRYENSTFTEPEDIANALNDHYITIGHKTANTIPTEQDEHIENDDEQKIPTNPPFTLHHITEPEVSKALRAINSNKASDIYKIKPAIIKDLEPFLTPILTSLYNTSIDENEYPDSLKYTKAIEVYKAKDKTLPVNYRPISLLPIIAKVLDTLLNNQLMTHLTDNNIISPTQYAFRPNSSTTLALQSILNRLHHNTHQHHPALAIYVDLSKAYDTISHRKLIDKLRKEFNFTPGTLKYFESYFHNRQQSLHTQHAQSSTQTITHGIPQGSTLSTTFFLLYINNIIQTVPRSKVYTYADDTTLLITAGSVSELTALAQSELTHLISYFHSNNLVPNATKTNFSVFYPRNQPQMIQLNINEKPIEQTSSARLLGLMIQDNLKHHQTINLIIRKLQPITHSFRYANKLLTTKTMVNLYYTHVYPHLTGGISIWGSNDKAKTYLQPLIKTHKKIIRLVKNLPALAHTAPIMTELQILNLVNLYTLRVCVEMRPFLQSSTQPNRPQHVHDYTPTSFVHDYPTRFSQNDNLYIPNATNDYFTDQYKQTWNSLPASLRNTSTAGIFKKNLKKYLLDQQQRQH
jgi:hypothetical protein